MKNKRLLLFLIASGVMLAQGQGIGSGNEPSAIMDQFKALRFSWFSTLWPYAAKTFGVLAVIEVAWTAQKLALETSDFGGWSAGIVRRMLWLGAFYALLLNGQAWLPQIIDSFATMGQQAAGTGPLSPSSIFIRGTDLMGALDQAASDAGFLSNPGMAISLELAGILAFLSFVGICLVFMVVTIESYILVGAAIIFLGFGGSRWTAPYVERVIGTSVAIGVKLLCVYLIVSVNLQMSATWVASAQAVSNGGDPAMTGWEIAGSCVICLVLSWTIPKFFAGLLGGSPSLVGSDILAVPAGMMATTMSAGAMVAGGVNALSGGGSTHVAAAAAAGNGGAMGTGGGSSNGSSPSGSGPSGGPGGSGSGPGGGFGAGVSGTNAAASSFGSVAPPSNGNGSGRASSVPPPSNGSGGTANALNKASSLAGSVSRMGTSEGSAAAPNLAVNHHD